MLQNTPEDSSNLDCDEPNDDDWFFNSFKRYNELQMFDFPSAVQEIHLTSNNNLCVALEDCGKNRNEILILSLPPSLYTSKSSQCLKLDRHLAFDHGYFTSSKLLQVKCVPNEEKLFISEKDGVALYDISCSESDIIKKLTDVPLDVADVRLAISGNDHYVACCSITSNFKVIIDFESMHVVSSIDDESARAKNLSLPFFTSSNIISFGDTITGRVTSFDVRNGKHINTIDDPGMPAHWKFNTLFDIDPTVPDGSEIFLFSTNGDFLVYDVRKPTCPVLQVKHDLGCESNSNAEKIQMIVCPANTKRFSVCGFDENVYLCEIMENSIDSIFTHDGHSYNADEFEPNVRTICSLWLPFVSENTLVSCGSNSSLQCWQFKIP